MSHSSQRSQTRFFQVVGGVALAAQLLACAGGEPPSGEQIRSKQARLAASTAPAQDVASVATAEQQFAFDALRSYGGNDDTLVYSPYSIESALGMTWAGAGGDTASQMKSALDFPFDEAQFHAAFNGLDQALASRSVGGDGGVTLAVTNALWVEKAKTFSGPFLDTLAEDYGAGLHGMDFLKDPNGSLGIINTWVSYETHGLIPQVLQAGDVTSATALVLTNTVYFHADWLSPFKKDETQDAPFTNADGSTSQTSFMNQTGGFSVAQSAAWSAIELPYVGGNVSMLLVLPAPGTFDALGAQLGSGLLQQIVSAEAPHSVVLGVPKLHLKTTFPAADVLRARGMVNAFQPDVADFSGMDGQHDLFINVIRHQATLDMDEQGTTAAAATAVGVTGTAAPVGDVTLRFDRPFYFVLRDVPTGAALFVGRVTKF